jgi:hypothetical protein
MKEECPELFNDINRQRFHNLNFEKVDIVGWNVLGGLSSWSGQIENILRQSWLFQKL